MEAPCYCTNHNSELTFPTPDPIGLNTALQELQQLTYVPEPEQPKPKLLNFIVGEAFNESVVVQRKGPYYSGYRKWRRHCRELAKPYNMPGRSTLKDLVLQNLPSAGTVATSVTTERASSPVVSRQDSGNKSNPSSPVKSQKSLSSSDVSLVRSRSLDDLDISKLVLEDRETKGSCYSSRFDIDNVSQRISKLHVN